MISKLSSVLQRAVLNSVMLWAVSGGTVQAEEQKPTLLVKRHSQAVEVRYSEEQNPGFDDFFYAMWVKDKAQCDAVLSEKPGSLADSKQPPQAGDFLCLLHTKKSLGADWERYAIGVLSPEPSWKSPGDLPPIDLPKPCVLETGEADNAVNKCTVSFD